MGFVSDKFHNPFLLLPELRVSRGIFDIGYKRVGHIPPWGTSHQRVHPPKSANPKLQKKTGRGGRFRYNTNLHDARAADISEAL